MKRLAGKTALVTGAGSGIGRATSILFAQEGANLVVLDRAPAVEDTAAAIRQSGRQGAGIRQGFSDESSIAAAIDAAVSEFGALDVCYANAGVSAVGADAGTDAGALGRDSQDQPDRHVPRGEARCTRHDAAQARLDHLHARRCRAAIGRGWLAVQRQQGRRRQPGANDGLSIERQRRAHQRHLPGLIETGMTRPIFEQARARGTDHKIGQLNPLRRAGAPVEIAQMALFLASDDCLVRQRPGLPGRRRFVELASDRAAEV
jgi:NAD(P)-dependent dehydrogenase (short-subunit alcohol dehydrogenase family)